MISEAAALIEQQQAVIDRLPKDGDGNPVIEGETYFRRGRGQVAGIVIKGKASMYGPTGARGDEFGDDMPTVYATWSDCYPSVEALEAAEAARVGKE